LKVWAAFCSSDKVALAFVSSKMKSADYDRVLAEHLEPFMHQHRHENLIFQQDNAPIHVSRESRKWFKDNLITLLDWPACSPDLSPIENIWGHFVRAIYAGNKQYATVAELKIAILAAWDNLTPETLQNHANSVPNRVFQVIQRNGAATDY
jgi:transposase